MSNRTTDEVFLLIKSLDKGEKRLFKLYANRNSTQVELKIVQLFNAMDGMEEYDEACLLRKKNVFGKEQLPNLKTHLYKQILNALRQSPDSNDIDIIFQEQMGNARILYNKALYIQALKVLNKLKQTAIKYHHHTYVLQAINFEKKIEGLHITRSFKDRVQSLTEDFNNIIQPITRSGLWSNLALQLYNWFISFGHSRNKEEQEKIKHFFGTKKRDLAIPESFYERLYACQAYCWYAYIQEDFLLYYRYAQKWVWLFEKHPEFALVERTQYLKGYHNLLTALYVLRHHEKFEHTIQEYKFAFTKAIILKHTNDIVQYKLYYYQSAINNYFLQGKFSEGLCIVADIENFITTYFRSIDSYRTLVFYYKIASLYFGSGDNETAIDYLQKIINRKTDLRSDLQCYARLLHLIAHYELGNERLIEYLFKSVYRFMGKMEHLGAVEEAVFEFLKKSFTIDLHQALPAFEQLRDKLKRYENDVIEKKSFLYLDIISWLESKIEKQPVEMVIRKKFLSNIKAKKHLLI